MTEEKKKEKGRRKRRKHRGGGAIQRNREKQEKMSAGAAGANAFRRFLNSETGPRTIHFWAPFMKWALVLAGANEMTRPVEKVSATQQLSLFATGAIWTRWAMVIKPRNILLASVNFFLGTVSIVQLARIYNWRVNTLGDTPTDAIKYMLDMGDDKAKTAAVTAAAAPLTDAAAAVKKD